MKLIEQYLKAVEVKLPWRGRSDIIAELRSLLSDSIEERFGSEPTEAELKTALLEFGSPGTVAAR